MEKYRKIKQERFKDKTKQKLERLQKSKRKSFLNREEKKAKKIFYKKSEVLQVFKVSMPFKA